MLLETKIRAVIEWRGIRRAQHADRHACPTDRQSDSQADGRAGRRRKGKTLKTFPDWNASENTKDNYKDKPTGRQAEEEGLR